MASENINQVFIDNPITTNTSTDLMYFGQSPYGAGNDAAMTYANFSAQFGAPYTAAALTSTNDTNVTITLGGTPATSLLEATSLTLGWTGQLSGARGGTGLANIGLTIDLGSGTTGFVLTSDSSGNATWQAPSGSGGISTLVADDIGTATGSTVTISGGTTGLTTTASGSTLNLTGTLDVPNGGTGKTSFSPYSVVCGGTSNTAALQTVSSLGSSGQVLTSNGGGALPTWQGVASAAAIQNQSFTYGVDIGTTNAYAITLNPAPSAYQDGQVFLFFANTANTSTTPTLNVNGLGAVLLTTMAQLLLTPGKISAGSIYMVIMNNTSGPIFQVVGF